MGEAGGGGDGGVEGDDGAVCKAGAFAEGGWRCGERRVSEFDLPGLGGGRWGRGEEGTYRWRM